MQDICSIPPERKPSSRIDGMEARLSEYEKGFSRVIETLQKIQDALLGRIDQGSPGLLEEIRKLKEGQEELKSLKESYTSLQIDIKEIKLQLKKPVNRTPSIPKAWQKTGWMIWGGIIVIGFIVNKFLDYIIGMLKVAFTFKP